MANVLTPAGGIFRRPRGGRPQVIIGQVDHRHISIHALREEGDTFLPTPSQSMSVFLSTPSARRATKISPNRTSPRKFLSTPSARRATGKPAFYEVFPVISIHALREEGDFSERRPEMSRFRFLSTPSARRATMCLQGNSLLAKSFLSTPSARRATGHCSEGRRSSQISIHALREEGDGNKLLGGGEAGKISIHALREEGDRPVCGDQKLGQDISIHALREEGDENFYSFLRDFYDFYPRPPRGGRHNFIVSKMEAAKFLSTPSARRATRSGWRLLTRPSDFYPRPPRGGRPVRSRPLRSSGFDFYPRPPRGGRPVSFVSCYPAIGISIHALREEGDAPR